ncbi:hypothetical protein [Streptomyces armeniacus]|nr:hypothetical protein [Streptomyces armeniacus]
MMQRYVELDIGLTDAMNAVLAMEFRTDTLFTIDRRHFRTRSGHSRPTTPSASCPTTTRTPATTVTEPERHGTGARRPAPRPGTGARHRAAGEAGEPAAEAAPHRPAVRRTERGSLRGQVGIADDFGELPDGLAGFFGTR